MQSFFFKLKGLLYKRVVLLNVKGGLFMQLPNTLLNSFVSKNLRWSTIYEFTQIDRLAITLITSVECTAKIYIQSTWLLTLDSYLISCKQ